MLKVLISAYACEPHKGSEPGVGWNWAKQIAKFAEVWVITRTNNKDVIEEELRKNPDSNLHFVYHDVPKCLSFWKKEARGLYLYYLLWQIGAFRLAKRLHREIKFDVVHHLTFGNIWLPTFMPFLKIPFIWGPVGGGEQIPKAFRKEYCLNSKFKEYLRDMILKLLKINILLRYTSKKANIIIAKTRDTANKIRNSYRKKVIIATDVATILYNNNIDISNKESENLKIIAVGRLDAWRGFDLLIKAFSKNIKDKENIKLLIIGDGNDKARLMQICKDEKLEKSVVFHGQVEREKYFEYLKNSSIFVATNLKEGGVTSLFEALSYGLPIVCIDIPGAVEVIDKSCGIKIKLSTPEQTINDLANALLLLANNPELRKRMGEAGRKRVMEHYTWDKKGEFIKKVYEEVLGYKLE